MYGLSFDSNVWLNNFRTPYTECTRGIPKLSDTLRYVFFCFYCHDAGEGIAVPFPDTIIAIIGKSYMEVCQMRMELSLLRTPAL